MIIKNYVVLRHDLDHLCIRLVEGPMTQDEAITRVNELRITAGLVTYVEDLQAIVFPSDGSDIVCSTANLHSENPFEEALVGLTSDEQNVLIHTFRLFHDYHYPSVTNHDLYTAIPDIEYDQVHAAMIALQEKHLVEMQRDEWDYSITSILLTNTLNEEEQEILTTIVSFQHAFAKPVSIENVWGNVRHIAEGKLPLILAKLAQRGLLTLDEHYTVRNIFAGSRKA